MDRILALSTVAGCIIAVKNGDRVVVKTNSERHGMAEYLVPLIQSAMDEAGLTFKDLQRIGAVAGPGSFTGLRVGLATAQGFELALGCDLVGITAFDLYRAAAKASGDYAIALDTLRGDCFSAGSALEPAVRTLDEVRALNVTVYGDLDFATKPSDAALSSALLELVAVSNAPADAYYLREAEISKPKSAA